MGTELLNNDGIYLKCHSAGKGKIDFTLAVYGCYHELSHEQALAIYRAIHEGFTLMEKSK